MSLDRIIILYYYTLLLHKLVERSLQRFGGFPAAAGTRLLFDSFGPRLERLKHSLAEHQVFGPSVSTSTLQNAGEIGQTIKRTTFLGNRTRQLTKQNEEDRFGGYGYPPPSVLAHTSQRVSDASGLSPLYHSSDRVGFQNTGWSLMATPSEQGISPVSGTRQTQVRHRSQRLRLRAKTVLMIDPCFVFQK